MDAGEAEIKEHLSKSSYRDTIWGLLGSFLAAGVCFALLEYGSKHEGSLGGASYWIGALGLVPIAVIFLAASYYWCQSAADDLALAFPEQFRTLARIVIFLCWAGWPFAVYDIIHGRILNIVAFWDYLATHGGFVAMMFAIGILSFVGSVKQSVDPYKKMSSYMFAVIGWLLFWGFLGKDFSDDSNLHFQLGASKVLIYYLGSVIATCIGVFFARHVRRIS